MFSDIKKLICTKEKSILDINDLVKWKRSKKTYNFDTLPETAIITVFNRKRGFFYNFKRKRINGIKGVNFLVDNKQLVLCTGCGFGAPHIISLCEELRSLGVSQFIFIGLAGVLDTKIKESESFYVEKVFSGLGTSYYYDPSELVVPKFPDWGKKLPKGKAIKSVVGWSTDAPFRETGILKDYYVKRGAKIVEMECAAVYAFANFYDMKSSCYIITSDTLFDEWKPPKNYSKLLAKEKSLISKIKKNIINT